MVRIKKKHLTNPWLIGSVLIIVALIAYGVYSSSQPGQYDDFAKCIGDKGATFYGAFWCPHCQAQKKMFGKSAKYLPYVECSLPSGNAKTEVCVRAGIESYPTWEFPDKTRQTGAISLQELAAKSGCQLPA